MGMKLADILKNQFVRITLMIFFLLFVYKILFAIGIFFAIEPNILSLYLLWLTMILIFAAIMPFEKSLFKVSKIEDKPMVTP